MHEPYPCSSYTRKNTLEVEIQKYSASLKNIVKSKHHEFCLSRGNQMSVIFLYIYKKLKQLKSFLTKIRPTLPLTESPLVMPKSLTKGRGRLISSIFSTKILILFIPPISYTHLLYPRITFLCTHFTFHCTCLHP